MANSPLIIPGAAAASSSAEKHTGTNPHPRSNLASTTVSSNAPTPTQSNGHEPEPLPDLAEQMNLDEKRKWVKGKKLGEGTYANVYLGHLSTNPRFLVAIKKIKVQKEYTEGLAPDAIRELKHLQELSHPNIISLLSVFSSKDQNLNLVLEYLPLGDLEMLIKDTENIHYGTSDIKAWMGMLCRGVWFCHANYILHRDIKPNNLLISADGTIKLADFGLARSFADPYRVMTSNVITRWYRPPELLFGAKHYSGAIDVWSVGCVFAELLLRTPFLVSETDIQHLEIICRALGTPLESNWPGCSKLPNYTIPVEIPVPKKEWFMGVFGTAGTEGVDLLMGMLTLDPRGRVSMEEALKHGWWGKEPKASRNEELPRKRDGKGEKLGENLKRRPGVVGGERGESVARRLFN